MKPSLAIVVIGRNEEARLGEALARATAVSNVALIYVDSQSSDRSIEIARRFTSHIVSLSEHSKLSAALARNEGIRYASALKPRPEYIQLLDGDTLLDPQWPPVAMAFLRSRADTGALCGFLHERYPQRSIYNRMCGLEWDTTVGAIDTCGGNALIRLDAGLAAGLFNPALTAGEEADFYGRMKHAGWKIERLPESMAIHDANILDFKAWWRRCTRGGMAAHLATAYYSGPALTKARREMRRTILWGLLPLTTGILTLGSSRHWGALLLLFPLLWIRIYRRRRKLLLNSRYESFLYATLVIVEKIPRFLGAVRSWLSLKKFEGGKLIEYK